MEHDTQYNKPELRELGTVGDLTGSGILDIGSILDPILGRPKPPSGSF